MRKKGFLLAEQVVKIVIALIALGFLVYLLSSLYFSGQKADYQEKATGFLKGTTGLKNTLENMANGETKIDFFKSIPDGWYLFGFTGSHKKPPVCGRENCVCVCENIANFYEDRQVNTCSAEGICMPLNLRQYGEKEIEIKLQVNPVTKFRINKDASGLVSISKA